MNNSYKDNVVTGRISAEKLTTSSTYIGNVAHDIVTKWGSSANTVIGNVVAQFIELSQGAIGNVAIGNVVTTSGNQVRGLRFTQGSFFNTAVSTWVAGSPHPRLALSRRPRCAATQHCRWRLRSLVLHGLAGKHGGRFPCDRRHWNGAHSASRKTPAYADRPLGPPQDYGSFENSIENVTTVNGGSGGTIFPNYGSANNKFESVQAGQVSAYHASLNTRHDFTDTNGINGLRLDNTYYTTPPTPPLPPPSPPSPPLANATALQEAVSVLQTAVAANASTIAALQTAASADAATIAALQAAVLVGGSGGSGSGSALLSFSGVVCASAACSGAQAIVNAFIGDSNVPITQAAAQNVTNALSLIVAAVTPSVSQLTGIVSALDTLAVTMLNNITSVGTASVTSPLLNMTVGLIPPSTATSAGIASITGAAFDPLPAAAFAGLQPGALVRLQYTSLGFNPYSGTANGSGVVSLAFTRQDGTPLRVVNLSTPITFAMQAPAAAADTAVACQWWDTRAEAYSTVGTFALPSPRPAGHAFSWAPNASVENGDYLSEAWQVAGPLLDNCQQMVLDCRSGQNTYESIALDPFDVVGQALIVCGAVRQRLRVFYGAQCAIWQPSNSFNCHWDATSQTFNGTGCVAATTTQCATLHLTTFASTAAPRIAVASASDLADVNPADLTTKLRMLFGVVIGLFGLMHVGALVGRVQDGGEQAATLAQLKSRSLGFAEQKGGAWTWRCTQDAVSVKRKGTSGSLVELARLIGMPYIRLRAAIPEALLPGSVAAATGCAAGLSAAYISSGHVNSSISDVEQVEEQGDDNASIDAITLTSTALVYALLSMRCIVSESELERQLQLSAAHFESIGADDAAGTRLRQLKAYFAAMLASDNLRKHKDWLNRARLWRLVLLSSDAGAYDTSQKGLAFALQAVSQRPAAVSGAKAAVSRVWALIGTAVALDQGLADDARPFSAGDAATYRAAESGHATDASFAEDCPLSFSGDAILGCMPPALFTPDLLAANAADGARLWTTALCVALMHTLEVSWALNQPAYPGMAGVGDCETCETILDRSSSFLETQFATEAALGAVMAAARAQTAEWAAMQQQRISALRSAQLSTAHHVKLMGMRIMGDLAKAGAVGHATFSIFLAPLADGIKRWQSFVVVISTLVALLTVNIWLTYSRALICCQDFRALLGCDADFTQPCRGSTADCVDLPAVFAGILDVGAPAKFSCTAFPDASSARDSFLMGLISFACSLPVTLLIANTFACANAADYTPAWLRWSARRTLLLGPKNWRYSRPSGDGYLRVGFATAWGVNAYYNTLQAAIARPQQWLAEADQRRRQRRGQARLQGAAAEARSKDLQYGAFVAVGVAATYICWAIFAWVRPNFAASVRCVSKRLTHAAPSPPAHLCVRQPDVQAHGPGGAGVVHEDLGNRRGHQPGDTVPRHVPRGGAGPGRHHRAGQPVAGGQRQLAGSARRPGVRRRRAARRRGRARRAHLVARPHARLRAVLQRRHRLSAVPCHRPPFTSPPHLCSLLYSAFVFFSTCTCACILHDATGPRPRRAQPMKPRSSARRLAVTRRPPCSASPPSTHASPCAKRTTPAASAAPPHPAAAPASPAAVRCGNGVHPPAKVSGRDSSSLNDSSDSSQCSSTSAGPPSAACDAAVQGAQQPKHAKLRRRKHAPRRRAARTKAKPWRTSAGLAGETRRCTGVGCCKFCLPLPGRAVPAFCSSFARVGLHVG